MFFQMKFLWEDEVGVGGVMTQPCGVTGSASPGEGEGEGEGEGGLPVGKIPSLRVSPRVGLISETRETF